MNLLDDALSKIKPLDQEIMDKTWEYLDNLSKPLRSLGVLEEIAVKISGMTGEVFNKVNKKNILIFCADNGVCDEGVSGCSQEVTNIVTNNLPNYTTGVGILAKFYGSEIKVIDVGVKGQISNLNVVNKKVREGSRNMALGNALTREEVIKAINIGIEMVSKAYEEEYDILGVGEMGIGNTTTSSSVLVSLTGCNIEDAVGKGAGITREAFEKKKWVVREAIRRNNPDVSNPIDIVAKVGGFDIAGMVGVFLGAAYYRIPVVIDGFISVVAALVATRINPLVKEYLIPSHSSKEIGYNIAIEDLGLEPMLNLNMRLGEGSGCPIAFSVVEFSCAMMNNMATFAEAEINDDYLEEVRGEENYIV